MEKFGNFKKRKKMPLLQKEEVWKRMRAMGIAQTRILKTQKPYLNFSHQVLFSFRLHTLT